MNPADRPRKVFLSTTVGADATRLKRLLTEARIAVVTWEDWPTRPGVVDSIIAALASSDGLVALLTSDRAPTPVVLEIGIALGAKLPVVLALSVRAQTASLPLELQELPIFKVPEHPTPAAIARLRSLLKVPRAEQPSEETQKWLKDPTYLQALASREWADESERAAAVALANLGAQVVAQQPASKRGRADLAIWMDGLPLELNPILVEVAGLRPRVREKQEQLQRYLTSSGSVLGILVLPNRHKPEWRVAERGGVLTLGADDLRELSHHDFVNKLIAGRNQIVHAYD